jgi:C4-dicarboxylate transporter, DctM subunit
VRQPVCHHRDDSRTVPDNASVGMNVFVIKSVGARDELQYDLSPFVSDVIRPLILIAFPLIALWLPSRIG